MYTLIPTQSWFIDTTDKIDTYTEKQNTNIQIKPILHFWQIQVLQNAEKTAESWVPQNDELCDKYDSTSGPVWTMYTP